MATAKREVRGRVGGACGNEDEPKETGRNEKPKTLAEVP